MRVSRIGIYAREHEGLLELSAGIGLFWTFLWHFVRRPNLLDSAVSGIDEGLGYPHLILLAAVVSLGALAVLDRRGSKLVERLQKKGFSSSVIVIYVAILILYYSEILPDVVVNAAFSAYAGLVAGWLYVKAGRALGPLGIQNVLRCGLGALIVALVVLFVICFVSQPVNLFVVPLTPIASILLIDLSQGRNGTRPIVSVVEEEGRVSARVNAAIPLSYFLTVLVLSLSFGWFQTTFDLVMGGGFEEPAAMGMLYLPFAYSDSSTMFSGLVSTVGMLGSIAAIALVSKFSNVNFKELVFLVGFPLIAAGFMVAAAGFAGAAPDYSAIDSGVFFVAGALIVAGFYFVMVMMLMLCSHFVVERGVRPGFAFGCLGFVVFFGQLCGYVLYNASLMAHVSVLQLSVYIVFGLLTCSLLLSAKSHVGKDADWREVKPVYVPRENPTAIAVGRLGAEAKLSSREMEVLDLLSKGYTSALIAETLVLSKDTARTHVRNIYKKAAVHSREELLRRIHESGDHDGSCED